MTSMTADADATGATLDQLLCRNNLHVEVKSTSVLENDKANKLLQAHHATLNTSTCQLLKRG
jgi:hypothetical protein